jgi:hypothetical protein
MLAIDKLPNRIFLYIKTYLLTIQVLYVKRAFPSTGFDYWAVQVGGAVNQNKHLLPVSMSLPFNHLPATLVYQ